MSCEAHGLAKSRREISEGMVDLIRYLAEDLPTGGTVVDLGTGSGTALLSVLAERNDAIHIHTYDLDVQWGQAVVNNERVNRVGDVTFYRGDILAEGVPFRGENGIDLLLVDLLPEHTEEILVRWLPMLNPRARVWVHNADQEHVAAVLQTIVSENDFPIITLDKRGKSWTGAIKEITFQKVADDQRVDESPPDSPVTDDESGPDPKTGTMSADPPDTPALDIEEEVQSSQSTTENEAQTSEPQSSQPKRAPKKRSRKKPTE